MAWTNAQQQAIEINGCNMLVSAAAGSGKTAVLTQRILEKVISGIDIDKMLIITFTNSAAAEMRERIGQAIASHLESGEGTSEMLCRQQALLSKASICTIDSFCREVVMRHFTVSGVDSTFAVGEESELVLLRSEILEDLLEEYYQKKDPDFLRLADLFADKSGDDDLPGAICYTYDFISSMPDPGEWLRTHAAAYQRNGRSDFGETVWGRMMLDHIVLATEELASEAEDLMKLAEMAGSSSYEEALSKDIELYTKVAAVAEKGSWRETKSIITSGFARKSQDKHEDKDLADLIKKKRDKMKRSFQDLSALFGTDEEQAFREMEAVRPGVEKLVELTEEFGRRYDAAKTERHLMSFSDLEHKALKVLRVPSIAGEYREKYREIYIDEYQDTNMLQEAIVALIAKSHNVFMVGDVKQSIYSFRHACPELFNEKEKRYAAWELRTDPARDCLVRLSVNFRSRPEVIDSVNEIFQAVMNSRTCGTEYGTEERLHYGASYYDQFPGDFKSEILVCDDSFEQEIDLIAERIRELMQSGFQVYDKALGAQRPLRYRDIVILQRKANTTAPVIISRLQAQGIPVYAPEKGGFFENYDVNVILSYIRLLDNPLQDIPLLTVLRSPLVGFSDDQLAQIRLHDPRSLLYEAMLTMEDESVQRFLEELERRRREAARIPISQFVWKLITETGYYESVAQEEDGGRRQANLRMLFDKTVAFENGQRKGFFRFIDYIEQLEKRQSEWDSASDFNEEMNVVRVVSVHKSKGLEYPVVFVAGAGKSFLPRPKKKRLFLHKKLGIALYAYDSVKDLFCETVMKNSIVLLQKREETAEEMRVLYVALTRAREKLIITASVNQAADAALQNTMPTAYKILNADNFLYWILTAGSDLHWTLRTGKTVEKESTGTVTAAASLPPSPPSSVWQYPHGKEESLPAKMSVSEIKRRILDSDPEEPLPQQRHIGESKPLLPLREFMEKREQHATGDAALSPTQFGTLLHACLEHADIECCRTALQQPDPEQAISAVLRETVSRMAEQGFILPEEQEAADLRLLSAFFLSDTGRRMLQSDQIRREIPFTLLKQASEIRPGVSGTVTVQGIIDCCFLENGEYVIVDYKSDRVSEETLAERAEMYRPQLALYGEALERITGISVRERILFFLRNGRAVSV